jgi:hypothetical protein
VAAWLLVSAAQYGVAAAPPLARARAALRAGRLSEAVSHLGSAWAAGDDECQYRGGAAGGDFGRLLASASAAGDAPLLQHSPAPPLTPAERAQTAAAAASALRAAATAAATAASVADALARDMEAHNERSQNDLLMLQQRHDSAAPDAQRMDAGMQKHAHGNLMRVDL